MVEVGIFFYIFGGIAQNGTNLSQYGAQWLPDDLWSVSLQPDASLPIRYAMKEDSAPPHTFTHIDARGKPTMVDVSEKAVTERCAQARSYVALGKTVVEALTQTSEGSQELYSKKGPVFQTAIIAGTMAVKKTSELIPFCHPLSIEKCRIDIAITEAYEVCIDCTVQVSGKTGVEMEALTGATVVALTIYDMCKALSHDIVIRETKLMEKRGGKQDFVRE